MAVYSKPSDVDLKVVDMFYHQWFSPSQIDRKLNLEDGKAHDIIVNFWRLSNATQSRWFDMM